tara:strand:+ start:141 stop:500 length:360 start_codon:yes stop_codon:yes gene_type:complete
MIDVSQATLDVIESVKNRQTIKFDYQYKHGVNEEPKTYTITPSGFFGDYIGFEGTDEGTEDRQFKRFRFDNVTEWIGVTKPVKVLVELEFNDYPTETEVEAELEKQLSNGGLMWRVEDE